MNNKFNYGIYPAILKSKTEVTVDFSTLMSVNDSNLKVSIGLTPNMPSEDGKPIFNILLSRCIKDNLNDVVLAEMSIEYTYRLDIEDSFSPSEEDLFYLLNDAGGKFAVEWALFMQGTRFQLHGKTKTLKKSYWIPELEKAIDFWEDSIRHLDVDDDGKPLDRG